jgi:hypothetical protein
MAAQKKARKKSAKKQGGARESRAGRAGSKTAFVLSLPAETSAKDVVARAKEQGISLSEAHVYTIRSTAKRGAGKPRGGRTSASGEPAAAANKAAFVRSLPAGTSYADAAEKAKSAGIALSKAYFYLLNSERKKKGTGSAVGARSGRRKQGRLPSGLMLTSRDPHEKAVLEAVEALGADRVRSVISAAERLLGT